MNRRAAMENYNYWGDSRVLAALTGPGFLAKYGKAVKGTSSIAIDGDGLQALLEADGEALMDTGLPGEWKEEDYEVRAERMWIYAYQVKTYRKLGVAEEELQAILSQTRDVMTSRCGYVNVPARTETERYFVPAESFTLTFPTRWAICDTCQGHGKHVNPAIDCGGLSQDDEFWEDDYDYEGGESRYMRGDYDVKCSAGCDNGKVRAVDESVLSPLQKVAMKLIRESDDEDRAYAREVAAERRMGA